MQNSHQSLSQCPYRHTHTHDHIENEPEMSPPSRCLLLAGGDLSGTLWNVFCETVHLHAAVLIIIVHETQSTSLWNGLHSVWIEHVRQPRQWGAVIVVMCWQNPSIALNNLEKRLIAFLGMHTRLNMVRRHCVSFCTHTHTLVLQQCCC